MKKKYLELMSKALGAYTDGHITEYFERVKAEGLSEHGFPRLTVNLGVLISHGYRTELEPLFIKMLTKGLITLFTRPVTILLNAPPITTPTAISITLPFVINFLKSFQKVPFIFYLLM